MDGQFASVALPWGASECSATVEKVLTNSRRSLRLGRRLILDAI